jgi:hypothetical protein
MISSIIKEYEDRVTKRFQELRREMRTERNQITLDLQHRMDQRTESKIDELK